MSIIRKETTTIQEQNIFLESATEIGEYIISLVKDDGQELFWEHFAQQSTAAEGERHDLYAGSSGIGLFFLELYKHTDQRKYLKIAERAVETAARREKNRQNSDAAFMTGQMGIAFAFLRLYEVTNKKAFLTKALGLAKSSRKTHSPAQEYLSGNTGTLLCLLHLHAVSNKPWLVAAINDYAAHIVRSIQPMQTGVIWDRSGFQSQPLCGFSHGVAGIGFVLLVLGHYFRNKVYFTIAEQAFAYENSCFDHDTNNWPDFRINMWGDEKLSTYEMLYKQGDISAFAKANDIVAWCHGASGIGLSRVLAYRLTRNQAYLKDLNRALTTIKATDAKSSCLCHGLAGNLEPFIESYLVLGRNRDWLYALTAGKTLTQQWKRTKAHIQTDKVLAEQQDLSLFMGIAGVGYSLLRLTNPHLTPSILAPGLPLSARTKSKTGRYPYLKLSHTDIEAGVRSDDSLPVSSFIQQVKREMTIQYPNSALLFIKSRVRSVAKHSILQLSDDELLDCTLRLNEDCRLYMPTRDAGMLFTYTPRTINEKTISPFCYIILSEFQSAQNIRSAITAISKRYKYSSSNQLRLLTTNSLEQIRQALANIILIPEEHNEKL